MAEHIFARCEYCHKDFEYDQTYKNARKRKYCCQTCSNKAQQLLKSYRRATFIKTTYVPKRQFDKTMAELHKQGYKDSDYAELQKKKTLDLLGRVQV